MHQNIKTVLASHKTNVHHVLDPVVQLIDYADQCCGSLVESCFDGIPNIGRVTAVLRISNVNRLSFCVQCEIWESILLQRRQG